MSLERVLNPIKIDYPLSWPQYRQIFAGGTLTFCGGGSDVDEPRGVERTDAGYSDLRRDIYLLQENLDFRARRS